VKPTLVRGIEDLKKLADELTKAGDTVVHNDDTTISAYRNGKLVKIVRVRGNEG
jgi:hypothetical protein